MSSEYLTVIKIKLDDEDVLLSYGGEALYEGWYEDLLLSAGSVKREVPYLPGSVKVADGEIEVSNVKNRFSILKASNPFRGREVSYQFGKRSNGEAGLITVFTGKIEDTDISPIRGEISVRDASLERFEDPCPGKINRIDFPSLPSDSPLYMAPIILGTVSSEGASAKGAVPCYLVDADAPSATGYVYLVSQHECYEIINVYNYGVLMAESEWEATVLAVGSRTYQCITFGTDPRDTTRPNEFEITADVSGLMGTASTLITNPVEAFRDGILTDFFGVSTEDIDTTRFSTAETAASDEDYEIGAWIGGVNIPKQIDVINAFAQSFMLPFFVNRSGEYAVKLLNGTDFFDLPAGNEIEILQDVDVLQSVEISQSEASPQFKVLSNREIASTIKYSYLRQWINDYYEQTFDHINADEENNLGRTVIRERQLPYVRDIDTANKVIATRLLFLTEAKQFASLTLPIHYYTVDLLDYVNITHRSGLESNGRGYQSATFMVIGLEIIPNPTGMEIEAELVRVVDSTPHCDSHSDQHGDSEHTDEVHADEEHEDGYSDAAHSDVHTDVYIDRHADTTCDYEGHDDHGDQHCDHAGHDDLVGHGDTTCDYEGHDDHGDQHCDHTDLWFYTDDHQDADSLYDYIDEHQDATNYPYDYIDEHQDNDDPYDYIDEHADYHTDTHSDEAHEDSAHSDTYTDEEHEDTPYQDAAHADTAHADFHCDTDASEIYEIGSG